MKNMRFTRLLCGVLMAGLLTSCMGLEESDPSALQMPEVKTFNVKDNGSLVFELSATVDKSAASRIAECGFYYGKNKNMSDAEKIECRMTGSSFSADLTLREYGETYYICSYISNGSGSNEILSDPEKVQLKELEAYVEFGVMETMAEQNAEGLSLRSPCVVKEGVEITKWGLCYGQSKDLDINDSHVEDKGTADNAIDCIIEGLEKNRTYYIRPYVYDGDDVAYGVVMELFMNHYTLEDALKLPDETSVQLSGIVVGVTGRGFLLSDEASNMLYVYAGNGWEASTVNVGDYVQVAGTMTTYYDSRELTFGNMSVIGNKSVPELDVQTLTKDNAKDFVAADYTPCKILVSGQLVKDGFYYNILLGDECVASPVFPVVDMEQYVGENVTLTGYYLWTSTNSDGKNVVSFVLTEVSQKFESSANCYVVSYSGRYSFRAVKGNSDVSVGSVSSVEALWESFGTSTMPKVGDLIKSVSYSNGTITFQTSDTFKEGNAVIAAKAASGKILWSWHIWFTDEPGECVYPFNAGIMMDRNLGATSATPGDVGALGLLYQWGRKDPFLGSSSISSDVEAKSTISWPSPVLSSSSRGTIAYAVEHPTTFITENEDNRDWCHTGDAGIDVTRWQSEKTIYDPCPPGWHIPEGGSYGVWAVAHFPNGEYAYRFDSSNMGMLFDIPTWYPAAGSRSCSNGSLMNVCGVGRVWSATHIFGLDIYILDFYNDGSVYRTHTYDPAWGLSVRCIQE